MKPLEISLKCLPPVMAKQFIIKETYTQVQIYAHRSKFAPRISLLEPRITGSGYVYFEYTK